MVCRMPLAGKEIGAIFDFQGSEVKLAIKLPTFLLAITCVRSVQMGHVSPFQTCKFKELSDDVRNFSINSFLLLQSLFEDSGVHRESISQNGSSLGSVNVHSLTLSYTFGSMRCDSRASFLARTLASLCFGCEPKDRVATFSTIRKRGQCPH